MGEKDPVGDLGLVLHLDPVPGLMVTQGMLEDHHLQHLLHLVVCELALVDEDYDPNVKGVDAFIELLAHI